VTDRHPRILILDFGSQYAQLIARRVRELGVYSELMPFDAADPGDCAGIILSGGPESVAIAQHVRAPDWVFAKGVPVLGICYGMQTLAEQLGGKVAPAGAREFGYAEVRARGHSRLLEGIEDRSNAEGHGLLDVWMSHGDQVSELPSGFKVIASTSTCPVAGMADEARSIFALQFHPEVTHTRQGLRILERFVIDLCGCTPDWTPRNLVGELVERIRAQVGSDRVLLALSGGVDSAVLAALVARAVGEQLTCVFVDTGLLRAGESDQVMQTLTTHMGVRILRVDASEAFLGALAGVTDPEAKRKAIGREFITVFEAESARIEGVRWLAQGTIYPDVIESAGAASGKAHVIKSHHNVGGLPERMKLSLLEPLRELFKDEVRKLGLELGLPAELVYRHPFPGPGLAVRMPGEVKREALEILRAADAIFIEELRAEGLYDRVSQAFAVFLPVMSVGVTGDARNYGPVIALRAVETTDFMTAHWSHLPYDFLDRVGRRIMNEIAGVSRVVYDISGKPPATIEWE
jgi:GMP synthase (glutamine-hydrolysing)